MKSAGVGRELSEEKRVYDGSRWSCTPVTSYIILTLHQICLKRLRFHFCTLQDPALLQQSTDEEASSPCLGFLLGAWPQKSVVSDQSPLLLVQLNKPQRFPEVPGMEMLPLHWFLCFLLILQTQWSLPSRMPPTKNCTTENDLQNYFTVLFKPLF